MQKKVEIVKSLIDRGFKGHLESPIDWPQLLAGLHLRVAIPLAIPVGSFDPGVVTRTWHDSNRRSRD